MLEAELATARDEATARQQRIEELDRWMQLVLERLPPADTAAPEPELEAVYSLDALGFQVNSAELSSAVRSSLLQLAQRLALDDGRYFVEIRGHTDTTGPEQLNLDLGRRRAQAVRAFLLLHTNLPAHRVAAVSYGETKPLVEEHAPSDRARNRRVEVLVRRARGPDDE